MYMKFIGWLNNSGLNPALVEACGKLYASCFEGLTEKDVELGKYLNGLQNGKELPPQPDDVAGSAQHYYYMFGNQPEFTANLLMAGSQVHDPVTDEDLARLKNVLGEGDPTKLKECATVFTYCDTNRDDMVKAAELFRSENVAEGFSVAKDCLTRLGYNVKRYQNGQYTDKTNLSTNNSIGKRVIRNQWLVHGTTPVSAINIAKYGFDRGNKIGMLAYNKSEKANGQKHDYTGDYMFAFDASDDMSGYDLTNYVDINRYGDALVVFKGSGYKVFHEGDDEYQVIFDYHEPTGCFLVLSTQQAKANGFPVRKPADNVVKIYNVQVYGQNDGSFVPLYAACEERECVQWIVDNGDQYSRYMFKWNKPVTESVDCNLPKTPLVDAAKALYESVEDTALTPFDDAIDIAKVSYDRTGGMDYEPEEGEDEESKYTVVKNTVDCIYGEMEEQLKSKGTVTVYRALSAKEVKDIRMDYLGESWSLYEDTAIEFGSHNGSNFILKAEAGLDAIDLDRTWEVAGACADLDEYEVCIEDTDRLRDLQIGRIVKRTAVYDIT